MKTTTMEALDAAVERTLDEVELNEGIQGVVSIAINSPSEEKMLMVANQMPGRWTEDEIFEALVQGAMDRSPDSAIPTDR